MADLDLPHKSQVRPKGCKQVIPLICFCAFRLGFVSAGMSIFYGFAAGLQIYLLARNYLYRIRPNLRTARARRPIRGVVPVGMGFKLS